MPHPGGTALAEDVMSNHGGEPSANASRKLLGTQLNVGAVALTLRWRTLRGHFEKGTAMSTASRRSSAGNLNLLWCMGAKS